MTTIEAERPVQCGPKPHLPSRIAELGYCLAFAVVAAFLAFMPLARTTFQLFFDRGARLNAVSFLGDGVPIPRALTWSQGAQNLVINLANMSSAGVLGLEIVLYLILAYCALRILNPSFRLTSGVDWDSSLLTRTYMHTPPLIKAFLIAIAAAIPAFLVWAAIALAFGDNLLSLWLRMALSGAAIWYLFSRDGVAGDYENGNYDLPRERSAARSLILRGAIAGTAATAFALLAPRIGGEGLFAFYQTLGGIGEERWRTIAAIACGIPALLAFSGGIIAVVLGAPGISASDRVRSGAAAFILFLVITLFSNVYLPHYLIDRYDFVPSLDRLSSNGVSVATSRLSKLSGVPTNTPGFETVLLLSPDRSVSLNIGKTSIVGLEASASAEKRIERFLELRGYQTALSDTAFKTLHDAAALRWDTPDTLRVIYTNLTRCPDPVYLRLFMSKLTVSPATPESRRFADLLADENRFAYLSRDSRMAMGDIYAHFGDGANAAKWYRSAEVPESRIAELMPERVMMSWGEVLGKITLNGRPAANCRVGLIPDRVIPEALSSALGPGLLRPFWFRWVGPMTTTGTQGGFHIKNVVAGHYRMLVMSPEIQLPPFSRKLRVDNAPGEMFVAYGKPVFDLGTIAIQADTPVYTAQR